MIEKISLEQTLKLWSKKDLWNIIQERNDRIRELCDQLAEKDKEKESFKVMYFNKCLDFEHLHEKFDDKCAEFELKEYDYKQTIFEKDQDKISFAVEKLEKVKEILQPYLRFDYGLYLQVIEQIDNQIKQLTHQHEDKGE